MRHCTVHPVQLNQFAFQYCNTVIRTFEIFIWYSTGIKVLIQGYFICRTYSVEDSTYPDDHLQGFHFPSNSTQMSMMKTEAKEYMQDSGWVIGTYLGMCIYLK